MGLLAGIYLALLLLTSVPAFQSWSAGVASRLLSEKIKSEASIKRLRLNMLGRVVLDSVTLYDRQDTLMLRASRIAAKVDFMPLLEKKIRISGAQLIGAKARIYKDGDRPFNFQFLMDAFSSEDTTSSPLDLAIGALVVRRGEVHFDLCDKPRNDSRFDPNHLHLKDLSLTARVHFIKPDSLALDLRNLSFSEQSGLRLQKLSLDAEAGKHSASIQNLLLKLPNSSISADNIQVHAPEKWSMVNGQCSMLKGDLSPRDLSCFVPKLANFADIISLSTQASLSNGTLRLPDISVSDNGGNVSLLCDATIQDIKSKPSVFADIKELRTGPAIQQFLTQNLTGEARELSPILSRLGSTKTSGSASLKDKVLQVDLLTESEQGSVAANGSIRDMQDVELTIKALDVRLASLLDLKGKARGLTTSVETAVEGCLPVKGKQASLSAKGLVSNLLYNGHEHRNIPFSLSLDGKNIGGELKVDEPNGMAIINGQWQVVNDKRSLVCRAELKDFAPHRMGLTEGYEGERFSGTVDADFSDLDLGSPQGRLAIRDFRMAADDKEPIEITSLEMESSKADAGGHLVVRSDFLNIQADGNFSFKTLPASFMHALRQNLPGLFKQSGLAHQPEGNDFRFTVELQDTVLAQRLLGSNIRLPRRSTFEGTINDAIGQFALQMNIPMLEAAGQELQNIEGRAEAASTSLQASLQAERLVRGRPVEMNIDAYAKEDKVTTRLRWDDKGKIKNSGDISMTGNIRRDLTDETLIDARMNPSRLVIGDTVWAIKPAVVKYHDKVVDVENLSISQGDRHIAIGGRISRLASDTLRAELKDIDIAYIMDLVDFHKVDFDGRTTGNIYATSLMDKPFADAILQVKDFTFNAANLGDMKLIANWGRQERAILLEADMRGPLPQHRTQVHGTIIPGKGMDDGLNLNIQTSHIDLSFLRKYTGNIFSGLEGRASGWTRVYGPFKFVNLEGDMFIDEFKTHILATGTDYHLSGDSVTLRPDNIWIRRARLYDYLGMPGMSEHTATVDAHLMHNCFKNFRFDVSIDGHNILGYNFPTQGSMSFFGTVYADAQVHLSGKPGSVNIDLAATPMPGTTINYNTATTGTVAETDFITYYSKSDTTQTHSTASLAEQEASSADMHINFDINANPNAQIRILMDPRTGDNISLYGGGRLRASYYNKGRFQLFGTYRVSEGNYRMSIRDLIRKDFTFQPDGTIVFGGDAMQAALNLTAKHTVPNVSLDDLSATGLGLSNTRVDCIMNIGGIAREPVISFDFDIPNANEDEKQMVRSMLSSEEERDMQAIYLLGVGRFYSYGSFLDKKQTQGGMAMNSVLSSALSSRFNQIMSQALGGTGWSFGTNLRTGEDGWQELDAEALVSGKMLSGRLTFNGNFGYRENKYKMNNNNFIGDFDIQYRLSPRSPFSLKAYNQTNDRYFTQSSLTTQGIGIKFQRDFSRWQELFHRAKKKSKKK
ncbi:MAG: translocation/assembly module TamB domain-containing protein [Bacteroidaceae bacterium]|nr:translocation/assembly module TamB domain-containing protein [Bacteroidaceae bacterium]